MVNTKIINRSCSRISHHCRSNGSISSAAFTSVYGGPRADLARGLCLGGSWVKSSATCTRPSGSHIPRSSPASITFTCLGSSSQGSEAWDSEEEAFDWDHAWQAYSADMACDWNNETKGMLLGPEEVAPRSDVTIVRVVRLDGATLSKTSSLTRPGVEGDKSLCDAKSTTRIRDKGGAGGRARGKVLQAGHDNDANNGKGGTATSRRLVQSSNTLPKLPQASTTIPRAVLPRARASAKLISLLFANDADSRALLATDGGREQQKEWEDVSARVWAPKIFSTSKETASLMKFVPEMMTGSSLAPTPLLKHASTLSYNAIDVGIVSSSISSKRGLASGFLTSLPPRCRYLACAAAGAVAMLSGLASAGCIRNPTTSFSAAPAATVAALFEMRGCESKIMTDGASVSVVDGAMVVCVLDTHTSESQIFFATLSPRTALKLHFCLF